MALAALPVLAGCGMNSLKPVVRNQKTDEVPGANLETANVAARNFFAAVMKKDIDKAVSMVLSVDRDRAKKELANPPKLPEELLLKIWVEGNKARVKCTNPGFEKVGLDMIYIDNQWWVTL